MSNDDWQTASKKKRYVNPKATAPKSQTSSTASANSSNLSNNEDNELYSPFSFWYYRKEKGVEDYDQNLKHLGDFHTVQGFWGFYCHLVRPDEMPSPSDYHLFKQSVKPMWEDPENAQGGKWMVRTKRHFTPRLWEDLVLALVGNQFGEDDVTGCVLSIRDHDILSVWTKNAKDERQKYNVRNVIRRVLDLPPGTKMEFKPHNASLKEPSSFRGSDIYVVPGPSIAPQSSTTPTTSDQPPTNQFEESSSPQEL